jgi:hypothetical protein
MEQPTPNARPAYASAVASRYSGKWFISREQRSDGMTEVLLRRPRRWVFIVLVALSAGLIGHIFWPRSDTRFVGKWLSSERSNGEVHERREMLEFLPNGRSNIWLNYRNGIKSPEQARWWVEEGHLVADGSRQPGCHDFVSGGSPRIGGADSANTDERADDDREGFHEPTPLRLGKKRIPAALAHGTAGMRWRSKR